MERRNLTSRSVCTISRTAGPPRIAVTPPEKQPAPAVFQRSCLALAFSMTHSETANDAPRLPNVFSQLLLATPAQSGENQAGTGREPELSWRPGSEEDSPATLGGRLGAADKSLLHALFCVRPVRQLRPHLDGGEGSPGRRATLGSHANVEPPAIDFL